MNKIIKQYLIDNKRHILKVINDNNLSKKFVINNFYFDAVHDEQHSHDFKIIFFKKKNENDTIKRSISIKNVGLFGKEKKIHIIESPYLIYAIDNVSKKEILNIVNSYYKNWNFQNLIYCTVKNNELYFTYSKLNIKSIKLENFNSTLKQETLFLEKHSIIKNYEKILEFNDILDKIKTKKELSQFEQSLKIIYDSYSLFGYCKFINYFINIKKSKQNKIFNFMNHKDVFYTFFLTMDYLDFNKLYNYIKKDVSLKDLKDLNAYFRSNFSHVKYITPINTLLITNSDSLYKSIIEFKRIILKYNQELELIGYLETLDYKNLLDFTDESKYEQNVIKFLETQDLDLDTKLVSNINLKKLKLESDITVKELVTKRELIIEGKEMNHCVGGYSHKVASGKSRVFSINYKGEKSTVEFKYPIIAILQHKKHSNKKVSEKEAFFVKNILLKFLLGQI